MRGLHYINSALWLANAVCWAFYAHVPLLAVASLGTAIATAYLGWSEQ